MCMCMCVIGDHQNTLVTSIAQNTQVQARNNLIVSGITPGASLLPWSEQVSGVLWECVYVGSL